MSDDQSQPTVGTTAHTSLPGVKPDITASIFDDIGLGALPDDEKQQMLVEFMGAIQTAVTKRIFNLLSDDDVKQFDALIEQNDENALESFITQKIPNIEDIAREETEKFKAEMVEGARDAREKISKIQQSSDAHESVDATPLQSDIDQPTDSSAGHISPSDPLVFGNSAPDPAQQIIGE